jgi:GNAT superfamily N-acetyltransferase
MFHGILNNLFGMQPNVAQPFHRDRFTVSADPSRLDLDEALTLLHTTFWASSMPRETLERACANSLVWGLYDGDTLIGFARAITDRTTYAYLTDVVVDAEYRGSGLGQWFLECLLAHPDLQGLRRIALLTRDARTLYERAGFVTDLADNQVYMERRPR